MVGSASSSQTIFFGTPTSSKRLNHPGYSKLNLKKAGITEPNYLSEKGKNKLTFELTNVETVHQNTQTSMHDENRTALTPLLARIRLLSGWVELALNGTIRRYSSSHNIRNGRRKTANQQTKPPCELISQQKHERFLASLVALHLVDAH